MRVSLDETNRSVDFELADCPVCVAGPHPLSRRPEWNKKTGLPEQEDSLADSFGLHLPPDSLGCASASFWMWDLLASAIAQVSSSQQISLYIYTQTLLLQFLWRGLIQWQAGHFCS